MNLHFKKQKAYNKNLVLFLKGKMVALFIIAIIGFVCGGLYGVRAKRAYDHISDADRAHYQQYTDALKIKQDAIETAKENAETTKKELADYQKYMDESLYMKLDANKYYASTVQYAINDSENFTNVYNAFATYINNGGLLEDVQKKYSDLQPEHWNEIVSVWLAGNTMVINVNHSTQAKADQILQIIMKHVKNYEPKVKEAQGNFKLVKAARTKTQMSNGDTQKAQNDKQDVLKNYEATLASNQNAIVSAQQDYDTYVKENEADYTLPQPVSAKKVVIYAVAGFVAFLFLAVILLVIFYFADDRIRGTEELTALGVPVLGVTDSNCEDLSVVTTMEKLCQKLKLDTVYLDSQCIKGAKKEFVEKIQKQLGEKKIQVVTGESVNDMIQAGNAVILTEAGVTKIRNIKETILAINKIGVSIMGAIVIQ